MLHLRLNRNLDYRNSRGELNSIIIFDSATGFECAGALANNKKIDSVSVEGHRLCCCCMFRRQLLSLMCSLQVFDVVILQYASIGSVALINGIGRVVAMSSEDSHCTGCV